MNRLIMITKVIELFKTNQSFFKGLSINLFLRVIAVIATLISGILITRSILEEGRGVYNLFITSLTMFNLFLNFGFNSSALTISNQYPEKRISFFSFNILIAFVSSLLLGFLLLFLPNLIPLKSTTIIFLFIITYLMYSIQLTVRSLMIGQDDIIFSGKVDAVIKVIVLLFCILLFYNDLLSITSSILLIFSEYLVYTTIGVFKLKIKKLDFKMDFIFLRTLFNFNTKSYIFGICFFILLRGDQYIVKYFLGNFQTGIYTQSGVITEQLQILSAIAATMFIPKFLKEKDFRVVIQKTNKLLLFVLVLNLIIGLVFYIMAPWVIEVYFKNKNQISIDTLRILLIGFIPWSLYAVLNIMMHSVRYKKSNIVILGTITVANILINYIYGAQFGIRFIAIVSTCSYSILFICSYFDMFYLKKRNYIKKTNRLEY